MKMIRLIAIDLDGTLLRSDETVSERARAALRAARARSLEIVVVTGRPPRAVSRLGLAGTGATDTAICANGALVYDLVRQELVEQHPLAGALVRRLVRDLRAAAPGVVFAAEAGLQFCREVTYEPGDPLDATAEETVVVDALRFAEHDRAVAKLLVRHLTMPQKLLLPLAVAATGGEAAVTRSGRPGLIEISAAEATKAIALERLCVQQCVRPDEVVAIGDHLNDLPMLRWAGRAVAVANAHPDVLAAADEIVASNDDDGVARFIEALTKRARRET